MRTDDYDVYYARSRGVNFQFGQMFNFPSTRDKAWLLHKLCVCVCARVYYYTYSVLSPYLLTELMVWPGGFFFSIFVFPTRT